MEDDQLWALTTAVCGSNVPFLFLEAAFCRGSSARSLAAGVWTAKFGIWKSLGYEDLQQPNRTVSSVTSADRPVLHATSPPSASLLGLQMCSVPSTIHTPSLKKRLACLHDL
ncbi:hypothetical protein MUK42_13351 [Musa troglodytarum]|uniref:Uncharacterized protein n=1 Tax=Musa troglodytarum TaxID=320322 RepID=A0A9E7KKI2_9LILI|nr:hypothetical protein MUK42_13351 [Musa troglodytarum]URE19414.1 hypothetical protein MUK42_13351 [Musa troglodytarum]